MSPPRSERLFFGCFSPLAHSLLKLISRPLRVLPTTPAGRAQRRESVTHSLPKPTVIAPVIHGDPPRRDPAQLAEDPRFSDCLPCRRLGLRVPSTASPRPASRAGFRVSGA